MTYYVRASGKTGWVLYKQEYHDGKPKQGPISKNAYHALGFDRSAMSLQQARNHAHRLNFEKRLEQKHLIGAAKRVENQRLVHEHYLPEKITQSFENWMVENLEADSGHRKKLMSHWFCVQKMISALELKPTDFANNSGKIFIYFRKKAYSLDYAKKLLRVLNLYGTFYCEQTGTFYKPFPRISPTDANKIRDAYQSSDKNTGPSEALTPEILENIKAHLKPDQFRWLFISIWLGLRPREIDLLNHSRFGCRVEQDNLGIPVLVVYQPKLVAVAQENRWKYIPLFLSEQRIALSYINGRSLIRPLNKTLRKLSKKRITCYGGRKGFIDLMLNNGQSLEDISAMMGHNSIETTWRKYRNRRRVHYTPKKSKPA